MKNPMFDKNFLKQLDYTQNKEQYVRITALSMDEQPIERLEGKITGGSINIDGNSSIRRTCSLSLTTLEEDPIITNAYWAYSNKFQLEIGLKNNINPEYDDIIWFKQGIYGITSFAINKSINNLSISISGQDKMCFLNGEMGGKLPSEINFGVIDLEDENGNYIVEKVPLYTIIRQAVHDYGKENYENIIINDLEIHGYELQEYKGKEPLYIFLKSNDLSVWNITLDSNMTVYANNESVQLKNLSRYYVYDPLDNSYNNKATKITFYINEPQEYYVVKIQYGETAGFHAVPLTYYGDLILNPGESVTTLLDKIKTMLGNFEYFYDLDGRFVFQKNKTYITDALAPSESELSTPIMVMSNYSYRFDDYDLIIGLNENPQVTNVKNDFSCFVIITIV